MKSSHNALQNVSTNASVAGPQVAGSHWRQVLTATTLTGALLAPGWLQGVEQGADGPQVVEVVLEGVSAIAEARVLAQLPTQVGTSHQDMVLNEDIRVLHEMGHFANPTKLVETLPDGNLRVIFRVEELPLIGSVHWYGVSYLLRRELEKEVDTADARYLNQLTLASDERKISQILARKKFVDAKVRSEYRLDPRTGIALVEFFIDLGYPIEVGRTEYVGLPPGAYKPLVDQVLFNIPGVPFQAEMMPWDSGAVANYIRDLGYLDAEVTDTRLAFADQVMAYEARARHGPDLSFDGQRDDRAVIRYDITAGQRYRLRQVNFVGQTAVREQVLRDAFLYTLGNIFTRQTLRIGDYFERRKIERGIREARDVLRNQGYAMAFFREDMVVDPATGNVDLTFQVIEDKRYRVGRVDVSGNTITRDAVVRRALRLHPGDLWSDEAKRESVRQLGRAGIFSSGDPARQIRVTPLIGLARPVPGEPDVNEVDVLVELDEEPTGQFNFQLGFTSSSGVVGTISFSERNFNLLGLVTRNGWRGAGQRLDANASWTADRTSLGTTWTNRHIWDSDYSFSTSFQRVDSSLLDWDEVRHTSSVSVGRAFFDNDLSLTVGYRYTDREISDVAIDASDLALNGAGKYWHHSLFARQSYELLNSRQLPTEGYQVSFNQEISGSLLGGSSEYYSLGLDADLYLPLHTGPLGGQTVLHLRHSNRWIDGIGDDVVPFYERIYGGGPAPRFRGFDRNDQSPGSVNQNGRFALSGGTADWVTSLELYQPLQRTNTGIRLVGFVDFGQVWDNGDQVRLSDLRTAAGFGIRMPMQFPIALDFAWLLDARSGEDTTQFHFTLGGVSF